MTVFKKLLFALPFLICFYLSFYFSLPYFKSTDYLFSLDFSSFQSLVVLSIFLFLASFFFVVFASLASDWRYILPISILAALGLFFIPLPQGWVLAVLSLTILVLEYWTLSFKLKTYLNFQAKMILGPSVGNLSKFLVLVLSVVYFLAISPQIQKNGFNLPDSFLKLVNGLTPQTQENTSEGSGLPSITSEQVNLLKQNPGLLSQYGLSPGELDQVAGQSGQISSGQISENLIKQQFQEIIKPFQKYMGAVLGAMFFVTIYSILSLILIISGLALSFVFWVLEKSGFVKFQVEQREVKKLVV